MCFLPNMACGLGGIQRNVADTLPQTGDETSFLWLYILVALCVVGVILALVFLRNTRQPPSDGPYPGDGGENEPAAGEEEDTAMPEETSPEENDEEAPKAETHTDPTDEP